MPCERIKGAVRTNAVEGTTFVLRSALWFGADDLLLFSLRLGQPIQRHCRRDSGRQMRDYAQEPGGRRIAKSVYR